MAEKQESALLKHWSFRIIGHGHDLPAGEFRAMDEDRAFEAAFKACKRFELPGWTLRCVETGTSLPVVKLTGRTNDTTLTPYEKKRGRVIAKRV